MAERKPRVNWIRRTWGYEWACQGVKVQLIRQGRNLYVWYAYDASTRRRAESSVYETLRVAKAIGHAAGVALVSLGRGRAIDRAAKGGRRK